MESTENEIHSLINTPFVQDFLKPWVLTIGSYFSLKGFIIICLASRFVWKVYVVPYFYQKYDLREKYGDYVVITNVTDPLGTEFAKAFLLKGHSLILIVRKDENAIKDILDKLEESRASGGGEIEFITKNIDKSDCNIYNDVKNQLKNTKSVEKIGILLNNAGFVERQPGNFLHYTDSYILDMVHSNVVDFLMITKAVLEIMIQNKKGLVVNVSIPNNCSAFSKKWFPLTMRQFTNEFNKIVRREFSAIHNLKIEAILPGRICYGKNCCPSRMNPSPETFVASAIERIGKTNCFSGYFYHSVNNFFEYFIPKMIFPMAHYLQQIETGNKVLENAKSNL